MQIKFVMTTNVLSRNYLPRVCNGSKTLLDLRKTFVKLQHPSPAGFQQYSTCSAAFHFEDKPQQATFKKLLRSYFGVRRQSTMSNQDAMSSVGGEKRLKECRTGENASSSFSVKSLDTCETPILKLNKVAVVGKMTRYEFEKQRYDGCTEEEFKNVLTSRGSNYETLLAQHEKHAQNLTKLLHVLRNRGIDYRICTRGHAAYSKDAVEWADAIITAGGDGTFLSAASKIKSRTKPLIGINTDPERSEGHLCLPACYSTNFGEALDKIAESKFRWLYRQRISITMTGSKSNFKPLDNGSILQERMRDQIHHHSSAHCSFRDSEDDSFLMQRDVNPLGEEVLLKHKNYSDVLPVLALNEVFIGESLASVPSYYELQVDDNISEKQKSSGICISTGTGSTAWSYNICRLHSRTVDSVLDIARRLLTNQNGSCTPTSLDELVREVTESHSKSFVFDANQAKMLYSIRDPMQNKVYSCDQPHNFAKELLIRSRCWDATLCIDGDTSFVFNDGATASLQILPEDALKTIVVE